MVDEVRSIDHFVTSLFVMFPHMWGVAHCGSSLHRDDFRDVDLRIVLDDDHVDQLAAVLDVKDLNMLLSKWGTGATGLPIDCQVQRKSEHDQEAYGASGELRMRWRGRGLIGAALDQANARGETP